MRVHQKCERRTPTQPTLSWWLPCAIMKMKQLQSMLEDLEVFRNPQIELEQYPTGAHLATCMLYTALGDGHIEDKVGLVRKAT